MLWVLLKFAWKGCSRNCRRRPFVHSKWKEAIKMQSTNFGKECSGSRVDRNKKYEPDFSGESAALLYPSILCGNSEI
jgi:hypothetical protein